MNKDSTKWLMEAQSLVQILTPHRGARAKLTGPRGLQRIDHRQALDFEIQLDELREQLVQKDATIAERDAKLQRQDVIIEALMQQMSEMEDDLSNLRGELSAQFSHRLIMLQVEKNTLQERVGLLERQLSVRQLRDRQLSARQLSARQLSVKPPSVKQLSVKQQGCATHSKRLTEWSSLQNLKFYDEQGD